jgi:septal ring factor EnvC (AmiA/AmiB activator)
VARIIWRAAPIAAGGVLFLALLARGATVNKDLEGIKKKIEKEKQGITQVQKREGSVLESLGKIEGELERNTQQLSSAQAKLVSLMAEMRKQQRESQKVAQSILQRKDLLKRRAVALYRWQRGGSPFVIFNGDVSLAALLQRRRYLESTVAFDRDLIQSLLDEAARYGILKDELAGKKEELDEQRRILSEVKASTAKEAEKRRELLASLRREKESRVRALKELEQAALRLQKMMDEISRRSAGRPQELSPGPGLEALRGKLEWPLKGHVMSGYGKARHREFSEEVFRKGLDIEARIGDPIRAVEKGKVVFAERFSGYGKMVIVDHGDRLYTIYAHLSEFLKRNGDAVDRGEAIALAGDSDSLAGAKLYFEMRKDGKSIDPLPWLRRP